jgi:DNA-binding LacI/PurR family transcriptional regulator
VIMAEGPTKPATSADVARLAGVSRTTVSSVLNGNFARFPEVTQLRVHEAAARLNYRPSPAARSLVSGRSDIIVILVPATGFGANLQGAAEAVTERARPMGASVVVRFAGPTAASTIEGLQALRPLAVMNFGVLTAEDIMTLDSFGTLVVPRLDVEHPTGDDSGWGIARMQADALLAKGPRSLWFADQESRPDPFALHRGAELRRYCRAMKLPPPREIEVPLELAGAVEAVEAILRSDERAGVACYSDDVALAVLAASRELNVAVPGRLAVVGMDNTTAGQLWSPRLTSVRVDLIGLVNSLSGEISARIKGTSSGWTPPGPLYELVPGQTT